MKTHPHPEQFRRKGIVFLAYDGHDGTDDEQRLDGYWDGDPDGPNAALEELPPNLSVWEAPSGAGSVRLGS